MRIHLLVLLVTGMVNATILYQTPTHKWRLQNLARLELKITNDVKNTLKERISYLHKFVSRFVTLTTARIAGASKEDNINSILPAFLLTRRLVEDWTSLACLLQENYGLSQLGLGKVRWPSSLELNSAAMNVLRAQWTYSLDIGSLANGVINLTAADCFRMADVCWNYDFNNEALEWLKQAFFKIIVGDSSTTTQTVMEYFALVKCFTGDSGSTRLGLLNLFQNTTRQKNLKNSYYDNLLIAFKQMTLLDCREIADKLEDYRTLRWYENVPKTDLETHRRLCSAEETVSNILQCRYVHYQQPHLRFQPFKLEELQRDPPVLRFYDAIYDNEAEALKEYTSNKMHAAGTVTDYGGTQYNKYRTSHTSWVRPGVLDESDRLTPRIGEMAQLNVKTAEANQLSRYSISGEYLPHHDYLSYSGEPFLSDRIATVMFYLNDVREGGNTIFLNWNLTVKPVKNSALLWFNYFPSGGFDEGSKHSGCPTLQGTKWVLNKWFHNEGQEFSKPCGLHPNDSFYRYYLQ